MTKICTKCGELLDIGMFTVDKTKSSGLRPSCKICYRRYRIMKGILKLPERLSIEYKRCKKCKKVKLKTIEFHKDSQKSDGYYSSCHDCRRSLYKNRKNPEKSHCSAGYVKSGQQRLHRKIMESILKRKLLRTEVIHHINHIKTDNRPENLIIITQSEHAKYHYEQGVRELLIERSHKKHIRICLVCNKEYTSHSGKGKYCSPTCVYKSRIEYFKEWEHKRGSFLPHI